MCEENNGEATLTEEVAELEFDYKEARVEFSRLLGSLELFSPLFYQLVNIGIPSFVNDGLDTAAVAFDREGRFLSFLWSKKFWNELDLYQKTFIACHECLHVYLSHGRRMSECKQPQVANIAADLVVNELLTFAFGFDRTLLGELGEQLMWVDKFLEDIPENYDQSMEYYYAKLIKQIKQMVADGKITYSTGKGGITIYPDEEFDSLFGKSIDNHDGLKDISESDENSISEKISNASSDEDKKKFSEQINSDNKKDSSSKNAGTMAGNALYVANTVKPKYNYKWTDIIKFWRIKKTKMEDISEVWHFTNRRIRELPDHMFLPVEHDYSENKGEKVEVWFFMDTSGSCKGIANEFFKCATTFPLDRFDLKTFCFDTRVYDINLSDRKLYGFGGTSFNIIENCIQFTIKKEKTKYPDAVFVFTDGYGNNVSPEKPDRWHWFLTEGGDSYLIPKTSHIYKLSDFK